MNSRPTKLSRAQHLISSPTSFGATLVLCASATRMNPLGSSSMRRPFQPQGHHPCCLKYSSSASMACFLLQFTFSVTSPQRPALTLPNPSRLFPILIEHMFTLLHCAHLPEFKIILFCLFLHVLSSPHSMVLRETAGTISTWFTTGNPVSGTL